jgi:heme-binding NEAT domain protein
VAIDTALTVSDVDSANLAGATVAITNFHAGEDALGFATQNGITGSFDTNTGILTLSGIASVSDYQTALRSVTYSNSSDNPSSDTRTISFQVDDGSSANHASNVVTTTVAVNPVNNPPVVAANGGSLSYTENGAAAIDTALTVSDVDSTNLVGATASIANFHAGEDVLGFTAQAGITGAFDSNTGILSLSGSASVAAYQAVLRSVTYSNTSDNPSADARTINYQVNDGSAPSNVATATVSVAPVNDPPVIVDPSDDTNQTAEDTQLHLVADPTIIVSDPDAGSDPLKATLHVEHGTLTLPTIPADLQGLITGLQGDGTATITFLASQDTINRLIHEVGVNYHPNHDFNGNADFTFTVDDQGHNGAGGALNAHTTVHIAVTPVNDAPVLAANGGSATYAENAPPTAIDTVLTISDVDSTNLAGATVSITGNFHQGQDVLGFASQNGITGDYNANTGVLTLSGISTLANYQAALQSVTYSNSSDNPSSDPRTISFRVDDGSSANNTSNVVTATVSVTPANDAPQLDAHTGGSSSQYTENGAAVAVDSAITINDIDSPTLAGATVSIGTGFHASEDRLNFTNQSTITGSYNSATGILTLVGFASLADYQTALASVTYSNTSDNPSSDIRTVSFQVDDGSAANNLSNVVTASVSVTPVNDAPAVNAHGGSLTYTENGPAAAIDTALTVGDVDSANLTGATVSITGNFHSGEDTLGFVDQNGIHGVYNNGVLTLSGSASVADYQAALRSVSYSDSSDDPSGDTRTISFQVNDGSATNNLSNVATATVSVTPVNDVPVITSVNSTGGVPTAALSLTAASYLTHDNSLVSGLGGNAGFGEQFLDRNDDGSTGAITIGGTATSVFGIDGLNFFGHTYTSLYINNNGNITFNGPQSSFTPSQITAGFGNPIIAPFWADVDTRGGSGNSDLVYYDLDSANHVLTVTWYDVGYYSQHTDKVDAFQLQLIGLGDGNFDIVYRYDDITWTTGDASGGSGGLGGTTARIGYSAGDGNPNHYFELSPLSGTNSVVNVDTDPGNQGNNPGVYLFQVLNGSVAPASVANGTIDFTDPDSGDHHSATVTPPATHLGNLVVG